MNTKQNAILTQQTPLITVSGELADFILQGHFCTQINSDLARESIDWQRSCYDITPIPVYVEAYFVRLDDRRHLLWDFFSKDNFWLTPKRIVTQSSSQIGPLNNPSLKRHHSFNSNQSQQQQQSKMNRVSGDTESTDHWTNSSSKPSAEESTTINYSRLFQTMSKRYCSNNGAQVLLNSYWLDSNYNLESYNNQVREHLIDWFQKILTVTACYNQIGLNQDFNIDFFVVIMVRNHICSTSSISHMDNNNSNQNKQCVSNNHRENQAPEQLLNLSSLISEANLSSMITSNDNNPKRSTKSGHVSLTKSNLTSFSLHTHSLSSSMSSLNTMVASGPTHLTHQQLADQIRNDLLVCFQVFRQKHLANGTLDQTGIPLYNSKIAAQLLERVIIFDSTSNASQSISNPMTNSSSTNPIISSTARTFSALSNFSASSIKITPSSMISMSPTRSSSRTKSSILSSSSSLSSSGSLQSAPMLNYSQFIIRIRHFLLEFYTKQFDCLEKLIRNIRELRTEQNWDYFGFFLLQEELAFAYESLGLYSRALIQYDELDALFSQLLLNASYHSGFGAPIWLKKLLMQNDVILNSMEDKSYGSINSQNQLNLIRHKSNGKSKLFYNNKYNAWSGLCLCNPESITNLRLSIVQSILVDYPLSEFNTEILPVTMEKQIHANFLTCSTENKTSTSPSDGLNDSFYVKSDDLSETNYDASRRVIKLNSGISLLDFRSYLYARQCHLLCLLNKPWELASRALPFIQTSVYELNMLEISITPGGIACWVFLSILEILHKCERYSDSSQLDLYSYHTVGLWSYARDNLIELGKICNLMPGLNSDSDTKSIDSSEYLHRMVELVAGMGSDPHIRPSNSSIYDDNWMSPQERLKDALSSTNSFLRNYLEITELTMGTYKHIGHLRCARFIGKQLAEMNLKLNKPQQALPFLLDLYHMFQIEYWFLLKQQACQLLAKCLEQLYFNMSNTISGHNNNNSNFNLEPIIRNAFRTYLLLFSRPIGINTQTSQWKLDDQGQLSNYLESMFKLIRNHKIRGIRLKDIFKDRKLNDQMKQSEASLNELHFPNKNCKSLQSIWNLFKLDSSLLVIHNSHSDLFHNNSMEVRFTTSLSGGNNSNLSSDSNIHNSQTESDRQAITSQDAHIKFHSNTNLNEHINSHIFNQLKEQCTCTNDIGRGLYHTDESNFFVIENIQIICDPSIDSLEHLYPITVSKNYQSFIAGSLLKLKLKIHSKLGLKLKLDRILVTLQCKPSDPELSLLRNSNESIAIQLDDPISSSKICSCMSSMESRHRVTSKKNPMSCCIFPTAYVESYYCQTFQSGGLKCLNEDYLLKQSDDSYQKFMSQVPISLLNQRLSNDDYFKYFRFLSSSFKFETNKTLINDLEMKTDINYYELFFHAPENLYLIAKELNLLSDSSISNVNYLWFNLDQLILFCQYDHVQSNQPEQSIPFVIVEDLIGTMNNNINNHLPTSFRLIKYPPSVELDLTDDQKWPNTCFIGIEQSVCLRLNSGTSKLPKGLKCYIEIVQIPITTNQQIYKSHSSCDNENAFDTHLINVTLHKPTENETGESENLLYFYLDRQLEPFETYQLKLHIRSSYFEPKTLNIKEIDNCNQQQNQFDSRITLANSKMEFQMDQYEFKLSLSWNWMEHPESYSVQTASCHFMLSDPFHLYPKIYTASPNLKLLQIKIFGSQLLQPNVELYFCYPRMRALKESLESNISCNISNYPGGNLMDTEIAKPINFEIQDQDNGENQFKYKLMRTNELNFVWYLNEKTKSKLYLELQFKPKLDAECWTCSTVKISYQVAIMYDYQTRYTIRQWIEPLFKQTGKNSEIIRIGHSCLLRVRIERHYGSNAKPDPDDHEFIMYELICDQQLWSFIASYSVASFKNVSQQQDSNQYHLQHNYENASWVKLPEEASGTEMAPVINYPMRNILPTIAECRAIKFSRTSSIAKKNQNHSINGNQTFDVAFEVMPLTAGYIPLPTIRIALYQESIDDGRLIPSKVSGINDELLRQRTTTTNTIESFSAMLTENLSLSSKNWSKFFPSGRNTHLVSDGERLNGRIEPLKPSQVYNYNYSSQVYVLPSIGSLSGDTN